MARWVFQLTDKNGLPLGAMRPGSRSITFGVCQTVTGSFSITEKDPMFTKLETMSTRVKVYDSTGALRCYGPILGTDEQGRADGQVSITATFADQSYELSRRAIKSYFPPIVMNGPDVGVVTHDLLTKANAVRASGILPGVNQGPWFVSKPQYSWRMSVLSAITELTAMDGSFEWALRYVDDTPPIDTSPAMYLDLLDRVGSDLSGSVFLDHGWAGGNRNVQSYSYKKTGELMANAIYARAEAGSQLGASVASMTTYNMRLEDIVSAGYAVTGPPLADLLARLVAFHLLYRKDPRRMLDVTLMPNGLIYGVNYVVGDTVTSRVSRAGSTRVSGAQRIWRATVNLDDNDRETASLSMQA